MDLAWAYGIDLPDRTLTAILGPPAIPLAGINRCQELSRYPFLYVCSNFSRILTGIHRRVVYSIRRGFTQDQVLTIVKESTETILFLEHDPTLYHDDRRLAPVIAARLREIAEAQAVVVVYSPVTDCFMREVFCHAHQVHAFLPYDRVVPPPRPLEAKKQVRTRQVTLPLSSRPDELTGKSRPGGTGLSPWPVHNPVESIDLGGSFLEVVEDPVGVFPDLPDE